VEACANTGVKVADLDGGLTDVKLLAKGPQNWASPGTVLPTA
jgi:hypothetical protein